MEHGKATTLATKHDAAHYLRLLKKGVNGCLAEIEVSHVYLLENELHIMHGPKIYTCPYTSINVRNVLLELHTCKYEVSKWVDKQETGGSWYADGINTMQYDGCYECHGLISEC